MAAPKKGTPGYERLKAHRFRKKVAAGTATEEQSLWLQNYEANKGKPRPPHVTQSTIVETNPIEATATTVPQTAPPPMEVPPLGGFASDASNSTSQANSSAPSDAANGATSTAGAGASPPSDRESSVAAIVEMAAGLWKSGMDKIAAMSGATERMFPDEFVDKIWKPAAIRLGVKYLPESANSDIADAVVVVGPPAMTVVAARRISLQLAAKKDTAEVAAKPVAVETPPERGQSDAPHAETPPSSNGTGVQMSKNDIRRTKLDPKQIPEIF